MIVVDRRSEINLVTWVELASGVVEWCGPKTTKEPILYLKASDGSGVRLYDGFYHHPPGTMDKARSWRPVKARLEIVV